MLAGMVFIENMVRDGRQLWVEREAPQGHLGTHLQCNAIVQGIHRAFSPTEWRMMDLEDSGHLHRVQAKFAKTLDDRHASMMLIVGCDFLWSESTGEGDGPEEMIGMGRAIAGQRRPAWENVVA